MSPRINVLNLPRFFYSPSVKSLADVGCSLPQFDACPVSSSSSSSSSVTVPSPASSTAHREDVSRLACSRLQAHSLRYFFLRASSRRRDRRPTGAVRLWQCGLICGTCERRDAAPLAADLPTPSVAQARIHLEHSTTGEKFEFRSIADVYPFVTRR